MADDIKLQEVASPAGIEAESMRIIDAEVPEPRPFQGPQWAVVRRMIHTTADFEMLDLARFHPEAVAAGVNAIRNGALIVTDTEMARCGIPLRRVEQFGCRVRCLMNDRRVGQRAREAGTTRALAAVDVALEDRPVPDIFVIGNAPTALIRLVEHMKSGQAKPALVVGMPVGFVNAAQSKELLMAQNEVPFISLAGRKGGSALAACVVNALAVLADDYSL